MLLELLRRRDEGHERALDSEPILLCQRAEGKVLEERIHRALLERGDALVGSLC